MTVARVFGVRPKPGCADEFERNVREHSIPALRRADGLVSFHAGRSLDGAELVMVTIWRDLEAVWARAGEHWRDAVLYGDEASLVAESSAEHFSSVAFG